MPAPRCRPFTVLDAMILVAATAGGLNWLDENALDNIRALWRGEIALFLLLCGTNYGRFLWFLAEGRLEDGFPWNPFSTELAWEMLFFGPPAVIGSWLSLVLAGRWRPEPGWIDRAGRILGWGWIARALLRSTLWYQYFE